MALFSARSAGFARRRPQSDAVAFARDNEIPFGVRETASLTLDVSHEPTNRIYGMFI